ncbi:hypothetical protein ACFVAD_12420 [Sutcliffiella sp. NPDC057660]|uniref:hypothetical protein n=1 Tax=Sutcliffiella sp. NPDC057660 TaxID=3346199 RepID=UPI0036C73EE3
MYAGRKKYGEETRYRLIEWTEGKPASERLGGYILSVSDYKKIDPSQPLGGRDGKKDLICEKEGIKWIAACYFPRGQKIFSVIRNKFSGDLIGVKRNKAKGIVFITNQAITVNQRETLKNLTNLEVEIFHQERILGILNSPIGFAARQEYLGLNMTIEEKISYSFMSIMSLVFQNIYNKNTFNIFDPTVGSGTLMSTLRSYSQNKELTDNLEVLTNPRILFNINKSDRFENKQLINEDSFVDYKKNNFEVLIIDPPYNLNPLSLT